MGGGADLEEDAVLTAAARALLSKKLAIAGRQGQVCEWNELSNGLCESCGKCV